MDDLERFIRYHVTPDDVVIDIGANQGLYTRLFAESAQMVCCLEPNPDVFKVLASNIQAPERANVRLLELAASDRTGTIDFYVDKRPNLGGGGELRQYTRRYGRIRRKDFRPNDNRR